MKKNILLLASLFVAILTINFTFAQSSVVMNEIYSRGTTDDPDWIEVYNTTSADIDLSGYKIYDSGGQTGSKTKKEFPSGSIVSANGFWVIITDNTGDASDFGLSSSGETVWLENTSGTVIDSVEFPALETTQSYGRQPDGETWQILSIITKGSSNTVTTENYAFLNEIYSRGTDDNPDWIEIYNTSSSDIDISGYKIYDSGGESGSKPKKEFPSGSVISANSFLVIVTDDTTESGFGLSSSGEMVWLEDTSGAIVDSVEFPALETTTSYSRIPDGGETWQITSTITPAESNVYSSASDIVMNEIYSRGTTDDPDWIEIYNLSSSDIDISGYKIYDSGGESGSKPKKEFPLGSIVPANGFLVIVTDDTTESGFGLSSSGEEVWLEDTSGSIIDDVQFPAMETTQSYGRYSDGSDNWQLLNAITRGASNLVTDVKTETQTVLDYSLYQNYPNPFNPSTTIAYQIGKQGMVTLKVYNILGKEIVTLVNEVKSPGKYEVQFNAKNLSSGIYFYKISANNFTSTKKFTLLK